MNILHHLTWRSMKANRSRTLVTVIGILLSAALFCSVTTLAMSIREYLIELNIYYGGDYYVKCHQIPGELAEQIRGGGEGPWICESERQRVRHEHRSAECLQQRLF